MVNLYGTTLVIGPPGTGKTTHLGKTTEEIVSMGRHPLLCSLTHTAASEIAGRKLPIPKEAVGTLHSHAFRSLGNPTLVVGHGAEWNEREPEYRMESGVDADDPFDVRAGQLEGDKLILKYDEHRARCVDRSLWSKDLLRFADRWERWKRETERMDFTDLIEQAVVRGTEPPTLTDVLLVDEAQDHSRLELNLLKHWAKQAGGLILVGDPWQALYQWRGAAPEMFQSEKVADDRRQVLAQSYRIPERVHEAAIRWVSGLSDYSPIDYMPRNEPGFVAECNSTFMGPDGIVQQAAEYAASGHSIMICGSCGFLLDKVVAGLRTASVPFSNPWRRRNGRWNPLHVSRGTGLKDRILEFLSPSEQDQSFAYGWNVAASTWSLKSLSKWVGALAASKVLVRGAKKTIEGLGKEEGSDRSMTQAELEAWFLPECRRMVEGVIDGAVSHDEALNWYERNLTSERAKSAAAGYVFDIARKGLEALRAEPRVYVGTIHSFKGAEADYVFILPDLSPSGMREWSCRGMAQDGIIRMFYVALTRARHGVYLCRPYSGRSVNLRGVMN